MLFVEIILEPVRGFHLFSVLRGVPVYHKNPLWFGLQDPNRLVACALHGQAPKKSPVLESMIRTDGTLALAWKWFPEFSFWMFQEVSKWLVKC